MRPYRLLAALAALTGLVAVAPLPAADPPAPASIDALLKAARSNDQQFLPVEQAFRLDATPVGPDRVRLTWQIADGYYLYRARIHVSTSSPAAQLGAGQFPAGQIKDDEYLGRQEIYHHELVVTVPVTHANGAALQLPLKISYQGCAEKGLCYPPVTRELTLNLSPATRPAT